MKKQCKKCESLKDKCEFNKTRSQKDGLSYYCKKCESQYKKEYYKKNKDKLLEKYKKYYEENKEARAELGKRWREKNKEKCNEYSKKWVKNNPEKRRASIKKYEEKNKEKGKARRKEWKQKNKEKIRLQEKERIKKNPRLKISRNMSRAINHSLKTGKQGRRWEELAGYTIDEFKAHIESLWEPWMNWENYGNPNGDHSNCWHIDHIKPVSWFNFKTFEDSEFKECWALSNLQPKEGIANISKQNKFIG